MKKILATIMLLQLFLGIASIALTNTRWSENIETNGATKQTSTGNGYNDDTLLKAANDRWPSIFMGKNPTNHDSNTGNVYDFEGNFQWDHVGRSSNGSVEIVVGIKDDLSRDCAKLVALVEKIGGKTVDEIVIKDKIEATVIRAPSTVVPTLVKEIDRMGFSKYIEPNFAFQMQFVPNDLEWRKQWGPAKIEADWAWNITTGKNSVLVAVLDTGIDWTHEDLAKNYVSLGYDWVNDDEKPMDDNGHGTHCAGIIAAVINNSIGIAGIAQASIMAEKCLDRTGTGYLSQLSRAIIHAADQGAKIISMSWGGLFYSELLHNAIKYAYEKGVLLIAAAGNYLTDFKFYPAAFEEVVAVSSTDPYDNLSYFSDYGEWVELAAPGSEIYSTCLNNSYVVKSGTSMACPHVAGVAALILSKYQNISRDQLRYHLRYTTDDLGKSGFDTKFGYGRINARKAVEQNLPTHDILVLALVKPPYIETYSSASLELNILNFGLDNEESINAQLLINGTLIASATVPFLSSGSSASIAFPWNPPVEGVYNVTAYLAPVTDENRVDNNVLQIFVHVGTPIKAYVMRSQGTYTTWVTRTWETLSEQWPTYGSRMVFVDYTTLDKTDITYEDISATDADVLIISSANDPDSGWEYTDSEIEAITKYVYEGHGLIVTASTFYFTVPNNNKLARLFGIDETVQWNQKSTGSLTILEPDHPLFSNIPNPYVMSERKTTAVPYSGKWTNETLVGGNYLALGTNAESAIVTYRGLVYISPMVEFHASEDDLQLFYNAITWSQHKNVEHDLTISLEAPQFLRPGYNSTLLNVTISNIGLNNESDIEFDLLIDRNIVANYTVAQLASGDSYSLSYYWSPNDKKTYNVTAYVHPVLDEDNLLDNEMSKNVVFADPIFAPKEGESADYVHYEAKNDVSIIQMHVTYHRYISPYEINVTYRFSYNGFSETRWSIVNVMNRWIERGADAGQWYEGWIETNVTLGSPIKVATKNATVTGIKDFQASGRFAECWEIPYNISILNIIIRYKYYYDRISGLLIAYEINAKGLYENLTLTSTNILFGTLIRPKSGDYAYYNITHLTDDSAIATGTMNFTYCEYVDDMRIQVRIDYQLLDEMQNPIQNRSFMIIVNVQTRLIENGPLDWNGTYYFDWISPLVNIGSTVDIWDKNGTVIGKSEYASAHRNFDTWLIELLNETEESIYQYDQKTGLLVESITWNFEINKTEILSLLETPVDFTLPNVEITTPKDNSVVLNATFTLKWSGSDRETGIRYYLIFVDSAMVANTTANSLTIFDLSEGNHTVKVEACDFAGNVNSDQVKIIVDITAPSVTITSPANGTYLKGIVEVEFSGNDLFFDRSEVYINNLLHAVFRTAGQITYQWNTNDYKDGMYAVRVVVYDIAGRETEETASVIVDNTDPVVEIRQPSDSDFVRGVLRIVAYVNDENLKSANLSLNGQVAMVWNSVGLHEFEWNTTTFADGNYKIGLIAYDKADNSAGKTVEIVVDNTPPLSEIVFPTNGSFVAGESNVILIFEDANLDKVSLSLDGENIPSQNGTIYLPQGKSLNDGRHILSLEVTDKSGNTQKSAVTFFVDNTSPAVAIISPENGTIGSGNIRISFEAWDSNLLNTSLIINTNVFEVTGTTSFMLDTTTLVDGNYLIKLVAYDLAGNKNEKAIVLVADNSPPQVSIISPLNGTETKGSVLVNFTAHDLHLVQVTLYLDEMAFNVTGQTSFNLDTTKVGDGAHVLRIKAVDSTGNYAEDQMLVFTQNVQLSNEDYYINGRNLGLILGGLIGAVLGALIAVFITKKPKLLNP